MDSQKRMKIYNKQAKTIVLTMVEADKIVYSALQEPKGSSKKDQQFATFSHSRFAPRYPHCVRLNPKKYQSTGLINPDFALRNGIRQKISLFLRHKKAHQYLYP